MFGAESHSRREKTLVSWIRSIASLVYKARNTFFLSGISSMRFDEGIMTAKFYKVADKKIVSGRFPHLYFRCLVITFVSLLATKTDKTDEPQNETYLENLTSMRSAKLQAGLQDADV